MQISGEGKIGFGLALVFGLGGGAIMVWPEDRWIGWAMMAFSGTGLLFLGAHHFAMVSRFKRLNWMIQTGIIAVVLIGGYVGYEYLRYAPPIDHRTELRKRFDTDFPNTLRIASDWGMTKYERDGKRDWNAVTRHWWHLGWVYSRLSSRHISRQAGSAQSCLVSQALQLCGPLQHWCSVRNRAELCCLPVLSLGHNFSIPYAASRRCLSCRLRFAAHLPRME